MPLSESQALHILSEHLVPTYAVGSRSRIGLGIGDDAAVLMPSRERTVWTIDSCSEGSHFLWEWMSPEDVAHKAFHAALSDVAAMGAKPTGVVCQLTLSARVSKGWLGRFARAQADAARATKCPVVGGNVAAGNSFSVVTSVLGRASANGVLTRDSARPGDELWLIGSVGLARAGLLLLQGGAKPAGRAVDRCLLGFRRPRALLGEGPRLVGRASACLDVSDGLVRDAANLARSSGVRIVIDRPSLEKQLSSELLQVAPLTGELPLKTALTGGEDYALLATGAHARRPRFARVIGSIEEGAGVFLASGSKRIPLRGGFEHRVA